MERSLVRQDIDPQLSDINAQSISGALVHCMNNDPCVLKDTELEKLQYEFKLSYNELSAARGVLYEQRPFHSARGDCVTVCYAPVRTVSPSDATAPPSHLTRNT